MDISYWIRTHPNQVLAHSNLIISAKTLFPKRVIFIGIMGIPDTYLLNISFKGTQWNPQECKVKIKQTPV
jgi:hypothetical protein